MAFDLSSYETVKERKKRFYEDHPEGRIIVELLNKDSILDYALFRAMVYIDHKDEFPKSIGYALELRDRELSISNQGKEYMSINYSSWLENCEESAVGRALDNAGYAGNDKCSREEMEKVERMSNKKEEVIKSRLDFIEVEAHLANLNTIDDIANYKKELWSKYPKMSDKQIAALASMFKNREGQVKQEDKDIEKLI